jgi:uncharacterized protein (TIGR00255 family)
MANVLSMTGFGRFETREPKWSHVFEVKSVNGRFLDVKWRVPAPLRGLEPAFERLVRAKASRGRVEVSLDLDVHSPEALGLSLDLVQVQAMLGEIERLAKRLGVAYGPDLNRLLSMPSLWRDQSRADPDLAASLTRGLEAALDDWRASRAAEGERLAADLTARITTLAALAARIGERGPMVLAEKREALRQRIAEALAQAGAQYSEERMLQEAALLADRLDVSEELTRLAAHLARLSQVLFAGEDAGKRLDFLIQELFREINTCGNKAQDAQTGALVVDFKTELERCREQVQNLE